jgi:AraC-like DNA-binding protein
MNNRNLGADFKYLMVSELDKEYGLTVNTVGFQIVQPNSPYPLSNHPDGYFFSAAKGRILNEYQFVYITKGSGVLTIDSAEILQVSKGQVIVLFPGQWHSYHPLAETGWNEYYIGFSGEIIENVVNNSFLSKESQLLDVGLNEELVHLFKRAIETVEIDRIASQQHLLGIVMHMLGIILSESQNKKFENSNAKQIVENAKIIMNENVYKDIQVEELSNRLNMNYTSFRKMFKNITGYAPAKYFQALKVQKAKQLLLESSYSVKEISYMLCFYSPESFNMAFKKSTGETPSRYRSICRNLS